LSRHKIKSRLAHLTFYARPGKEKKVKAAVFYGAKDLRVETVEDPKMEPTEYSMNTSGY